LSKIWMIQPSRSLSISRTNEAKDGIFEKEFGSKLAELYKK